MNDLIYFRPATLQACQKLNQLIKQLPTQIQQNLTFEYPEANLERYAKQFLSFYPEDIKALHQRIQSNTEYLTETELAYLSYEVVFNMLALAAYEFHQGHRVFPVELEEGDDVFDPMYLFKEMMDYEEMVGDETFKRTVLNPDFKDLIQVMLEEPMFAAIEESFNLYFSTDEDGFNMRKWSEWCLS